MTQTLARGVKDQLKAMGIQDREIVPTRPKPFQCLPTATFLGFTSANINKFTSGFKYVRSLGMQEFILQEYSQAIIAFLQLLKFRYRSYYIKREIGLQQDKKTACKSGKQFYRLGFSSTIKQYSYRWFLPKINQEQYTFLEELGGRSLFSNIYIVDTFKARQRTIQEIKDDFIKVNILGRWLRQYKFFNITKLILQ